MPGRKPAPARLSLRPSAGKALRAWTRPAGSGATWHKQQNLVLSTQNQVAPSDLGAASSTVTFFRSLGG
ncbi:hypothetical protein, partial [Streptomyces aureus]